MSDRRSKTQFMPPGQHGLHPGKISLRMIAVLAFGLLALATTITTTVVLSQFRSLNKQSEAISYSRQVLDLLTNIRDQVQDPITSLGLYGHGKALPENFGSFRVRISASLAALQNVAKDPPDVRNVVQIEQAFGAALVTTDQLLEKIRSHNQGMLENDPVLDQAMLQLSALRRQVNQWRDQHINNIATSNQQTVQALARARWMSLARIAAAASLIALLIAIALRTIHRRAQLTEHLHHSSQLWHGILSNLDQGVSVHAMDNRLMFWNDRFRQMHGIAEGVLHSGMSLEQVLHASTNLSQASVRTILGESKAVIATMRRGESSTITNITECNTALQVTARPMTDEFYIVTLTDVTELHRSKAAAVDTATQLSTIMDNVPDAIITLNENGQIDSWSTSAERMFGYASADIRQQSMEKLLIDPSCDRQDDCLKHLIEGQGASKTGPHCEFMARHQDGHAFPIDLGISEMRIGNQRQFVVVARDITERRAVDQMKREFIATVSHELRTPLTSISGSLGLLNANPHNDLSQTTQRLVNIAHKNSERLTRLINDILDLEKGEAGRLRLNLSPLSLFDLVEHAIEANRAYAASYQVSYVLTGVDPRKQVLADGDRIMQVLTNLMSNAAKFSPPGTHVIISVQAVDDVVKVAVKDHGSGIPEGFHERVFSRFSQADGSDARPNEGSGLGLAISKSLIEHHGGFIDFDTSPHGTTFWFELPIHEGADTEEATTVNATGRHAVMADDANGDSPEA